MQEPGRESPGATLRALMTERHAAFAQEMWALFETTVAQLEEEVRVLRAQNERQRGGLEEETQKRREAPRSKAKRTNPKKGKTKPVSDVEILTENSSDSENEWKRNNQPKEEEEESALSPEPEGQTENSSDSEDERGPREKPPNAAVHPDPERVGGVAVLSDPHTENSSDSEPERKEKPASSGARPSDESPPQKKTKKKKSFECSICRKSFNYKSVLTMHTLSHGSSRPYECSQCGFSFMMKYRLDRHMEIHKRNRPSGFDEEPPEGPSSSSHAMETENVSVPAPSDGENVSVPGSSDGENVSVPGSSDGENVSVPGPSDDEDAVEFENTAAAAEETDDVERAHRFERPQCLQCGKTFSTPSNMSKHIRTIHSKMPSLAKKLQVQVQWRHQHLQCSLCDRRFRFQTELTRHVKRAHSVMEKTAEAVKAEAATKAVAAATKAVVAAATTTATKAAEKPFQCDVCQKSFRDRNYLQEHIRIHTGEKPYRCLICGKYFTFRKSHNAHMKLHESSR